uniref:Uncharacterized protein n=1 Tax=Chromera velia CCMP2878 TaxID=1169474 RepID=A0A0G4G0K7_9ALVE|eukprot:Cvel_19665.t1-p1 / transcript=Cvel_19665.t1 / gene=Cvel_19665 / organism=Chromera_velia_CCMP2878 / gene_product=hypothetical protein / transcript_product=hypothetical protein / location=Cvel_scaffold1714:15224-15481(-) / protein_length=86 / sequence_SO=supercontig / SO=protein_coding / is_pseudo=false
MLIVPVPRPPGQPPVWRPISLLPNAPQKQTRPVQDIRPHKGTYKTPHLSPRDEVPEHTGVNMDLVILMTLYLTSSGFRDLEFPETL